MPIAVNNSYLLGLYSSSTTSSGGFDLSSLALGVSGAAAGQAAITKRVAPTAPWTSPPTPAQVSAAVTRALAGGPFINETAAKLDLPGASADYRKLFALYQALNTLSDLATQASAKGVISSDLTNIQKAFARGIGQISTYVDGAAFEGLRLADGAVGSTASAKLSIPKAGTTYTTPPLTSSTSDEVPAFQGNVQFNISIKRINEIVDVPIDLSSMGAQPRTIGNVVNFINDQLAASGMSTRLASLRQPGLPRTLTVGGKAITLPPASDQWALQVKIGTSEAVTFSAPQTAGAVYLTQATGDPNPDKDSATNDSHVEQQLLKFQTDTTDVAAPLQGTGQANWVDGRVFSDTLGKEVGAIHATQTAPDGSVYLLADVTAATAGQSIKGSQDVALLKYDSAGKLIYSRTLGASSTATGLGLAVSADGKVAVTGSVTGALDGTTDGALNSGATGAFSANVDSFVTLYDAAGQEQWTVRRGGRENDEASQVTFGSDGTVYVAGRTQSALPGTTAIGGYDGYIEALQTDSNGNPKVLFTQMFGTTDSDKPAGLVVDGSNLVTASVEGGHAVLRSFDISSGTPVQSAIRDLGDLQGGSIAGLALNGGNVIVAGASANGTLLSGATVTKAASGGSDGFAAEMSANLSVGAGDSIAYFGGSGDDKVTAMAVSNGKVWLAGQAGTDLPGTTPMGTKDSFLTSLDVSTGAVDWTRRFTGRDGMATPSSIAVAPGGASILDEIGLPTGTLNLSDSQQLVARSSLRAGDQFTIKAGGGVTKTITIDQGETLDTLAQKIVRASGFSATVTLPVVSGVKSLTIKPQNPRQIIEIGAGPAGKNALVTLGLNEGVIRSTVTTTTNGVTNSVPADGKSMLYGLGLESTLNLFDAAQISHAQAQIAAAMGVIRKAYQGLVAAATPVSAQTLAAKAAKASGPVPAYLTAKIANYQAGLARLTGGGG
jgi:hypothetical protein